MKKLLVLLLAGLLCICISAIAAGATDTATDIVPKGIYSGTCGDGLSWSFHTSTGVLDITGTGDMDFVNMPWYSYRNSITSVNIGNGVTSIKDSAFYNCNALESVIIGDSVTSIGGNAFYSCDALESIYLSDIAAWCAIQFGDINANPLYYANNLYLNGNLVTELVIPNGVTSIKDYAFYNYDALISITIPDSVTSIGDEAFYNCNALQSITIPDSVTSIGDKAFYSCIGLESVIIGDSVTSIGDEAFYNCNALQSITIPDSVTSIGNSVFSDCDTLDSVTLGNSVTTIGGSVFYDCDSLISITIPDSVTSIGHRAFYDCDALASAVIGNGVTTIAQNTFYSCSSLSNLTIGNSVTTIQEHAFYDCESLQTLVIPASVTTIKDDAFFLCFSLKSVYVDSSNLAPKLNSGIACGNLLGKATAIMFKDGITNVPGYIINNYTNTESLLYLGKTYNSYSNHAHIWSSYTENAYDCSTPRFSGDKCSYCNGLKGSVSTGHQFSASWSYNSTEHWHECTECHEKKDTANHTYSNSCDTSCNTCGRERTITHSYSAEWDYNSENHWHECTVCGNKKDTSEHRYDNTADTECNVCGHTRDIMYYYSNCPSSMLPESEHNYEDNTDIIWTLSCDGADHIELLFSTSTRVEYDYDKIYIYNGNDYCIGTYTDTDLAGQTVTVFGDTVKIRLISDHSYNYYGFSLSHAKAGFASSASANSATWYLDGAAPEIVLGDVNSDSIINSLDAAQVLKHDAILLTLSADACTAADVNDDGIVNSLDAALILKFDAALIPDFDHVEPPVQDTPIDGEEYVGTWTAVSGCSFDTLVINRDYTFLGDGSSYTWQYQDGNFICNYLDYSDTIHATYVKNGFLTIVREGFMPEGAMNLPLYFETYAKQGADFNTEHIDENLIGEWEGLSGSMVYGYGYGFSADGTGYHNPDVTNFMGESINNPITWCVKGGMLLITDGSTTTSCSYAVSGDTLYLDGPYHFYNKKDPAEHAYVGTWINVREGTLEKLVMYENGSCTLHYEDSVEYAYWYISRLDGTLCIDSEWFYGSIYRAAVHNDAVLQIDSYNGSFVFVRESRYGNLTGDIHSGLVGSWSGSDGSGVTYYYYTFNSDGTGIYKEHNFYGETTTTVNISWFVNGDVLTVESATETVYYVYELDGDRLECYTTSDFPDFNLIFSRQ